MVRWSSSKQEGKKSIEQNQPCLTLGATVPRAWFCSTREDTAHESSFRRDEEGKGRAPTNRASSRHICLLVAGWTRNQWGYRKPKQAAASGARGTETVVPTDSAQQWLNVVFRLRIQNELKQPFSVHNETKCKINKEKNFLLGNWSQIKTPGAKGKNQTAVRDCLKHRETGKDSVTATG